MYILGHFGRKREKMPALECGTRVTRNRIGPAANECTFTQAAFRGLSEIRSFPTRHFPGEPAELALLQWPGLPEPAERFFGQSPFAQAGSVSSAGVVPPLKALQRFCIARHSTESPDRATKSLRIVSLVCAHGDARSAARREVFRISSATSRPATPGPASPSQIPSARFCFLLTTAPANNSRDSCPATSCYSLASGSVCDPWIYLLRFSPVEVRAITRCPVVIAVLELKALLACPRLRSAAIEGEVLIRTGPPPLPFIRARTSARLPDSAAGSRFLLRTG
jgi:hypothetical protein